MQTPNDRPYNLGVALSGGGARGFAHAGALAALEKYGLKPDVIAGVSSGSVISALYAAGIRPVDMIPLFAEVKFSSSCELAMSGGGFFKIDKFLQFLSSILKNYKNIEDLRIPTYICATDFDHCQPVAFSSGDIVERVGASCSVPIIFRPRKIDGVNYVDGGVLRNLPAWAIRHKCKVLIGVNCSPLAEEQYKTNIYEVAQRAYRLMSKNNTLIDQDMCDLVISTSDIANHKTFNMKEVTSVFKAGFEATKDAIEKNRWLLDKVNIK